MARPRGTGAWAAVVVELEVAVVELEAAVVELAQVAEEVGPAVGPAITGMTDGIHTTSNCGTNQSVGDSEHKTESSHSS